MRSLTNENKMNLQKDRVNLSGNRDETCKRNKRDVISKNSRFLNLSKSHQLDYFHRTHLCFRIFTIFLLFYSTILTAHGMAVQPSMVSVKQTLGSSALRQVQDLAEIVALANKSALKDTENIGIKAKTEVNNNNNLKLLSGLVGFSRKRKWVELRRLRKRQKQNQKVVTTALESLERDMELLENIASQQPQLSTMEFILLSASVLAAASGPLLFTGDTGRITEVLAPASAAFCAAIGIGAEYTGKVAVADGKETAAATIMCAAEAESLLATAERVKAVTPLCVGIGATAATFALLAPALIGALQITNIQLVTEMYLICPLVSVLAAAVASLALQETQAYTSRAISVGNRRFAKSGLVGRTWLSAAEQIERNSLRTTERWTSFATSVLPAPIIGALVSGPLSTKTIVVSALAAAQSAYFLAQAENAVARATDAVALKARSAAVCDTYANQGARSAAILPFTSALSSLCAAATAAIVELPWLHALANIGGVGGTLSQMALVSIFPALSSLFAAAASVSKARCEVDAEAAIQASLTLALDYNDGDDPVLRPFQGVIKLIKTTASSGWNLFQKSKLCKVVVRPLITYLKRVFST